MREWEKVSVFGCVIVFCTIPFQLMGWNMVVPIIIGGAILIIGIWKDNHESKDGEGVKIPNNRSEK